MASFTGLDLLISLIGGLIIGIASTLNLSLKGRITGVSGIIFNTSILIIFQFNLSYPQ